MKTIINPDPELPSININPNPALLMNSINLNLAFRAYCVNLNLEHLGNKMTLNLRGECIDQTYMCLLSKQIVPVTDICTNFTPRRC